MEGETVSRVATVYYLKCPVSSNNNDKIIRHVKKQESMTCTLGLVSDREQKLNREQRPPMRVARGQGGGLCACSRLREAVLNWGGRHNEDTASKVNINTKREIMKDKKGELQS